VDRRAHENGRAMADVGGAVRLAAAFVVPLLCLLGVLGGIGSFATVRHLAAPWFGTWAWIVPVGIDIGILALLAWDLLAEYLGLSWPVLRWTAWAFIAATVYLNVTAGHNDLAASIMHAAMPILFITVIEGIRHLIRQYTGLAAGTRIERIPLARWMLAPRTTFLLARRMILWYVTSYSDGLALEYQRLLAVSRLQRDYGRWLWRWRAPLHDRLALRLAVETEPPSRPRQSLSEDDERLVGEATAIMRDAKLQHTRLSQAALARELRTRGNQIANDRLRWLTATARNRLPEGQSELTRGSNDGGK